MSSIGHLYLHLKQYKKTHKSLYIFSVVIFFWAIFDGILTYALPLILEEKGFSSTQMGLIIGSSSIAGCAFDFLMCRFVKEVNFRRVLLFMFAFAFLYAFILWQASIVLLYLLAMAVWGVYYDLANFGIFDFVSRYTEKADFSANFGIVQLFKSLGSVIAPIVAGILIIDVVDYKTFTGSLIFLGMGFFFLMILILSMRGKKKIAEADGEQKPKLRHFFAEMKVWKRIGRYIFPALILTVFLNTIDAFFWTIGPVYSEVLDLGGFNGLFLAVYFMPSIFVGIFAYKLTEKYGKLKVAYVSFLTASALLSCFALVAAYAPVLTIALTFLIAIMIAISYPSLNGSYADDISSAPEFEKEVEGLADFSTNVGYVIGPMLSGYLADILGVEKAFSTIGVVGAVLATILIVSGRRKEWMTRAG